MSLYEQLKSIGDDKLQTLARVGFLKSTFQRNVKIYERFLDYLDAGQAKTDAVVLTAEDFHISDRHVFSIVAKFSET